MSRPNGSRVQRARRHLAEDRAHALRRFDLGRARAIDALTEHARLRAFPMRMPRVQTVRGVSNRIRHWFTNKMADIAVWRIEVNAIKRLDDLKMGVDAWLSMMRGQTIT